MMNQELLMSPNRLVTFLQKPAAEFTKADIINYIQQYLQPIVTQYLVCNKSEIWP